MAEDDAEPPVLRRKLNLRGRCAVVTSSAHGIGRVIALRLARAGGTVAINAQLRTDCGSVIDEIEAFGGFAIAVEGSIETREGCEALWAESTSRLGCIDILVASGGTGGPPTFLEGTEREASIWEANVFGPLRLARSAAEGGMRSPGGTIVNVATVPDTPGHQFLNAYRASQAALVSATRALGSTLAPAGIRINIIAAEMGDANVAAVTLGPLLAVDDARITPGRPAAPDDVAATALYLASDASAPTTGTVFQCASASQLTRSVRNQGRPDTNNAEKRKRDTRQASEAVRRATGPTHTQKPGAWLTLLSALFRRFGAQSCRHAPRQQEYDRPPMYPRIVFLRSRRVGSTMQPPS